MDIDWDKLLGVTTFAFLLIVLICTASFLSTCTYYNIKQCIKNQSCESTPFLNPKKEKKDKEG